VRDDPSGLRTIGQRAAALARAWHSCAGSVDLNYAVETSCPADEDTHRQPGMHERVLHSVPQAPPLRLLRCSCQASVFQPASSAFRRIAKSPSPSAYPSSNLLESWNMHHISDASSPKIHLIRVPWQAARRSRQSRSWSTPLFTCAPSFQDASPCRSRHHSSTESWGKGQEGGLKVNSSSLSNGSHGASKRPSR